MILRFFVRHFVLHPSCFRIIIVIIFPLFKGNPFRCKLLTARGPISGFKTRGPTFIAIFYIKGHAGYLTNVQILHEQAAVVQNEEHKYVPDVRILGGLSEKLIRLEAWTLVPVFIF
jgi:hypothetical protein